MNTQPFPNLSDEQLEAAEQMARVDEAIVRAAMLRIPAAWRCIQPTPSGGYFARGEMQAGLSVQKYEDRRVWLHVSLCCRTASGGFKLPDWEQMKRAKNDFIGAERWAYQVFPDERKYVNQNPWVLHMYALLDSNDSALPDFTMGLGTL